jgi:hypothetical protein
MAKALFTFANFQSDEYVESSDAKINTEVRKAHKKLREIDVLKKKEVKTKEELDKIQMEMHWLSILFPNEEKAVDEGVEERKRKQQKRHDEKERIKERKRKAEEIANERRREEERKREELRQEREAREQREQSKKERQENIIGSVSMNPMERRIEKEFMQLLSENDNNVNKVFRLLSLKYHPDKHLDDKSGAEEIQKILGNVKEMYMEI